MLKQKILYRKFNELNGLKGDLISRSEENKNDIIKKIKNTVDELTMILEDFEYIKSEEFIGGYRAQEITMNEVQNSDGKDGKTAYIVVNGTVYDVADSEFWEKGVHFGLKAGGDVTEEFMNCHGASMEILKKLRVVGVLKE